MEVLGVIATPTASQNGAAGPPTVELRKSLRELAVSTHALEGAHEVDLDRWQSYTRRLSLAGVVLSAIVATSVYATIAVSPETWAQITVGSLGVLVAVLTAVNHYGPFTDQAESHRKASRAYAGLYTRARRIPVELENHEITREQAEKKLNELQDEREKLEDELPAASLEAYREAFSWAKDSKAL